MIHKVSALYEVYARTSCGIICSRDCWLKTNLRLSFKAVQGRYQHQPKNKKVIGNPTLSFACLYALRHATVWRFRILFSLASPTYLTHWLIIEGPCKLRISYGSCNWAIIHVPHGSSPK